MPSQPPPFPPVSDPQAAALSGFLQGLLPNMKHPSAEVLRERLPDFLAVDNRAPPTPVQHQECELLTIPQVLAALKISRVHLWRLARDRRLIVTRIGRRILVARSDLEGFIQSCRETKKSRKKGI